MSTAYDLYQPGHSWLHCLDPRSKLVLALCLGVIVLLYSNLWVILGVLLLTQLLLLSAGIARARLWRMWKLALPMMGVVGLFWLVFYPGRGPAWVAFWLVRITAHSLAQALAQAGRLGALAFVVLAWLSTTDQTTLVHSLVALGLPYAWGLTLAMALRFLPSMAGNFRLIADAQRARALDLEHGNLLQRTRAYTPIIVAMFITGLRTAENLARALEARALGAHGGRRTALRPLHLRQRDLVCILVCVTLTIALCWARYALGLGADPLSLLLKAG